jgi:pSer/pThr/pTyr-binding forkhead associated (FHA) protein
VINCAKCGKENQDHYKFCLGCGAELTKSSAPKPFSPNTPPHGIKAIDPNRAPATAVSAGATTAGPRPQTVPNAGSAAPSGAADGVECPQCGQANSTSNRFCAACGFNLTGAKPAGGSAPAAAPAASSVTGRTVTLVALRADGSEAGTYTLPDEPRVMLGRDVGAIFSGDSYLSPRHASMTRQAGNLTVRDEGSLNGVYLKLKPQFPWVLRFGDVFRIGQEIIRLEALETPQPSPDGVERLGSPKNGYLGRLALVIGRDTTGNAFVIPGTGVHCGRERGDILFSEDGYVSGLHCRISPNPKGQLELVDVGSSNGTFVRLTQEYRLTAGDILLMGQQLFRVDLS